MKLLSLTVIFAAVIQSISACGRIYGSMQNSLVTDSYAGTMFDACSDKCKGSASGSFWAYNTVANIRCNPGYGFQLTHNGHEAYYSTPHGKYDIKFGAKFDKVQCGVIRDNTPVLCTSYTFNCWAFTTNCNGCGNYKAGSSPTCASNNGMKRGLESNDDDQDPNPVWAYNRTIVHEMINNATLKLHGLALEIYNHEQGNNGNKLQSASTFNITALHEKYYGTASI